MTPNDKPITERVAVLEVQVAEMRTAMKDINSREGRMEALLNTICVNVATLTQRVDDIVKERSVWKNPLVWTNLISLAVAVVALVK